MRENRPDTSKVELTSSLTTKSPTAKGVNVRHRSSTSPSAVLPPTIQSPKTQHGPANSEPEPPKVLNMRRLPITLSLPLLLLSCTSEEGERIAELERQIEALSTQDDDSVQVTDEITLPEPPPTTQAPTTTERPPPTTEAPTTTEAPSAPPDSLEGDKALIRRLVYEQQQFIKSNFEWRNDWTADHYLEFQNYLLEHTEPMFRAVGQAGCQNFEGLTQAFWLQVPTSREAEYFDRWVVDLETVEPDPDWRPKLYGREIGPFEGRTYIATVTFEYLDGSRSTLDVHFNVQGSEAFWFTSPEGDGCRPGAGE